MQTLSATAARQAGARAAECRRRLNELADHRKVGPDDVRRARAALQVAIKRAVRAEDRCTRRTAHLAATATRVPGEDVPAALPSPPDVTELRQQAQCLDGGDLFLHYFSLGGHCTEFELDAFVHAALDLPDSEITVLAQAMWEMTEF